MFTPTNMPHLLSSKGKAVLVDHTSILDFEWKSRDIIIPKNIINALNIIFRGIYMSTISISDKSNILNMPLAIIFPKNISRDFDPI